MDETLLLFCIIDLAEQNIANKDDGLLLSARIIRKLRFVPKMNKLHLAIIWDTVDNVKKLLPTHDPRSNNHLSYTLAVRRDDNNIINLVVDNIIIRMFLHREILSLYLLPELYNYMSKLL